MPNQMTQVCQQSLLVSSTDGVKVQKPHEKLKALKALEDEV